MVLIIYVRHSITYLSGLLFDRTEFHRTGDIARGRSILTTSFNVSCGTFSITTAFVWHYRSVPETVFALIEADAGEIIATFATR